MAGTIKYDVSAEEAICDGKLRYVKPSTNSKFYAAGFDQDLVMEGLDYRQRRLCGYSGRRLRGFLPTTR